MPSADRQRVVRVAACLDLLRASRLKDLEDGELARLRERRVALLTETRCRLPHKSKTHAQLRLAEPSGRVLAARLDQLAAAFLRLADELGELRRDIIDAAISAVHARRENAIKMIEAAATALGRFVTEEIEAPARGKHPGGAPEQLDWKEIC